MPEQISLPKILLHNVIRVPDFFFVLRIGELFTFFLNEQFPWVLFAIHQFFVNLEFF